MTDTRYQWFLALLLAAMVSLPPHSPAAADKSSIIVQSTTSTANSGLYDHILPIFEAATGITVHVVAVGTGQAIRNAERCDGDVLLVHARAAEEAFVAAGFGVERHDLMYNDFVIVGPSSDPSGLAGGEGAARALAAIAEDGALFGSRGDDSGTHKKELLLWNAAGIDPAKASGSWYRETGSGMGATLNAAVGMGAYTLTDRATWISFANKADFRILVEGDPGLLNPYGVILVDPEHCPNVASEAGGQFVGWLLSPAGQAAIASYALDGAQLFFPNASDGADASAVSVEK